MAPKVTGGTVCNLYFEIIVVFLVAGMKTGKDIGPRLINFANKLKAIRVVIIKEALQN